jgi:hypothetical protein
MMRAVIVPRCGEPFLTAATGFREMRRTIRTFLFLGSRCVIYSSNEDGNWRRIGELPRRRLRLAA